METGKLSVQIVQGMMILIAMTILTEIMRIDDNETCR